MLKIIVFLLSVSLCQVLLYLYVDNKEWLSLRRVVLVLLLFLVLVLIPIIFIEKPKINLCGPGGPHFEYLLKYGLPFLFSSLLIHGFYPDVVYKLKK